MQDIKALPTTKHQLEDSRIDAYLMGSMGILYVGFHGSFLEGKLQIFYLIIFIKF